MRKALHWIVVLSLLAGFIACSKEKEELKLDAEKIIRAYDPCMSCATNFLKMEWIES